MLSLMTMGFLGAGVIATNTLLQNMTTQSADGVPRVGTQDARPLLAGMGLLGTLLLPGLGQMIAAGVGAGALINMMMPQQQPMLSGTGFPSFGPPTF